MHCHTAEGSPDAIVSIEDTIEKLRKKGYNGMLVTDHNSYKGHNSLSKKYNDFVVLRGVEYDSLDGGHLLIVLPTRIKYEIFEYRIWKHGYHRQNNISRKPGFRPHQASYTGCQGRRQSH